MTNELDTPHPDVATLIAYHSGQLEAQKCAAVKNHLANCPACSGQFGGSTTACLGPSTGDPSPTASAEAPVALVDHPRYRILERIGEGGMGVVYKAEHRVMGRIVALKQLTAELSCDSVAMDRFRREVRLASRLTHPNIVTAYDADEAGGLHFLVMEFVEGQSLEKVIRDRGPLAIPTACEYVRQAALGLQHAHEKGMIHRDIKPHNLMLTYASEVKILDFGLARVADIASASPASLTALAITQPHTIMGTPDFFSPEQARDPTTLDIRSDLYSLGCTLYYLLTGKPPFAASGVYAKMIAHYKEPPPDVTAVRPDVPPPLGKLLLKLLAKSPDQRYQVPAELAAALAPFAKRHQAPAAPGKPSFPGQAEPRSLGNSASIAALPMASEIQEQETGLVIEPTPTKGRSGRRWLVAAVILAIVGGGGAWAWLNREQYEAHVTKPESTIPATPIEKPESTPSSTPITAPKLEPAIAPPSPPVVAARKKQVLVIIPPEFASAEFTNVLNTLKQRGIGTITAAPEKKILHGYTYSNTAKQPARDYEPEYGLKEISSAILDSLDGVIIASGEQYQQLGPKGAAGAEFRRIIENVIRKKKIVGGIGSGVMVLGMHGFLENSQVSVMPNRPKSESLKVKDWVTDTNVVIDLPFITTGKITHTKELTEDVCQAIQRQP